MRALVADDDRVTAATLSAALRQWQFEVTTVHDGTTAWQVLTSERPPLVVLDWMMPGIDGPTLCTQIRRDPSLAHTYILLLTSRDAAADRVSGLDSGADDYLVKPFDREELRARVHVGQRVATIQSQLADQVAQLQKALAAVKQLEGFLSVCMYCKRVKSEVDSWQQIENYISEHSDTTFSHGICPGCFEQANRELEKEDVTRG